MGCCEKCGPRPKRLSSRIYAERILLLGHVHAYLCAEHLRQWETDGEVLFYRDVLEHLRYDISCALARVHCVVDDAAAAPLERKVHYTVQEMNRQEHEAQTYAISWLGQKEELPDEEAELWSKIQELADQKDREFAERCGIEEGNDE